MTNFQKFKAELCDRPLYEFAVDKELNKPMPCALNRCDQCLFDGETKCLRTVATANEWLTATAVIDWNEVPIDAKIRVRLTPDGDWQRGHFAGLDSDGRICTWKGLGTSWTQDARMAWTYAELMEDEI